MVWLEFAGLCIVVIAFIALIIWFGWRTQKFTVNIANRSRERAVEAREELLMQQEAEKRRQQG